MENRRWLSLKMRHASPKERRSCSTTNAILAPLQFIRQIRFADNSSSSEHANHTSFDLAGPKKGRACQTGLLQTQHSSLKRTIDLKKGTLFTSNNADEQIWERSVRRSGLRMDTQGFTQQTQSTLSTRKPSIWACRNILTQLLVL